MIVQLVLALIAVTNPDAKLIVRSARPADGKHPYAR